MFKNNDVVLEGQRNQQDKLWDIPVSPSFIMPTTHPGLYKSRMNHGLVPTNIIKKKQRKPKITLSQLITHKSITNDDLDVEISKANNVYHKANVIIRKKQIKSDLAKYLHATLLSPTLPTLVQAINNNHFVTWPGLTTNLIKKYLPKSIFTYQGHMKSEKQGLQSSKHQPSLDEEQDYFPTPQNPNVKSNQVCYALVKPESTTTAYMDLTGRFPKKSSRGNEYILVGYHYDGNYIHGIPLKDRRGQSISNAWQQLNNVFKKSGVMPEMYVLDNETSKELIEAFNNEHITYQLVTPYKHRNNQAERAIQTYKSHLKSGLAGADPQFPLSEWDRFIPQCNITLNLLRKARVNPKLSAYAYMHGNFNFNSTPMAPPGTKVLIHQHPDKRGSYELNGEPGWYVGPSLNHYRCVQCYVPRTRATMHSDSVEFFPKHTPFPSVTMLDFLRQTAEDLVAILAKPPSTTVPSLTAGDDVNNAILNIAKLLKRADKIPTLPAICSKPLPRVEKIPTPDASPKETAINSSPKDPIPNTIPYDESEIDVPSPRVKKNQIDPMPLDVLLTKSSLPKNARYNNSTDHQYNLRSTPRHSI